MIVRINCECYQLQPGERPLAGQIWPKLIESPDDKWVNCEEKFIDLDDIPPWVADTKAITIKPLSKVKFVSPAPKFTTGNIPEIKEFVKHVTQIAMPGFELLRYAAIQVETDACTNAIQQYLDEGWRIIAVMPQPGQRRPDYVMVRETKP